MPESRGNSKDTNVNETSNIKNSNLNNNINNIKHMDALQPNL